MRKAKRNRPALMSYEKSLAVREQQLSDELHAKMAAKKSNGNEPANPRQSKQSFFLWLSFAAFLLIGGSVCAMVSPESLLGDLGAGAVPVSFFTLPVALVWLVLWIIRRRKNYLT